MRRPVARDLGLLFPIAILLPLGFLVGVQWHSGSTVQRARDSAVAAVTQVKLLESIADGLRDAERTQRAYITSGTALDLGAFQHANRRLTTLSGHLQALSTRPGPAVSHAGAPALPGLLRQVRDQQSALARIAMLRRSQGTAAAQALSGVTEDARLLDRVNRVAQALEASHRHELYRVKGGIRALRWIAVAAAILGMIGVLGVVRQLRRAWRKLARAEAEQRLVALQLRASLDSLTQGVAVFSAGGMLLNWNTRLSLMLGLPAPLLRSGLPYDALEAHLAGAAGEFLEPLHAILGDAPDAQAVVYERAAPDGAAGALIEIRRTLMPHGGFVLTLTDMTERVRAELVLREAHKMQAIGQLTGGIAHDFNNMLTVILASLEVSTAERDAAGDELAGLLTRRMHAAIQAAETGAALTRQLLNFACKQPLEPVPLDLARTLPDLLPLLRHTMGEKITISFQSDPGLWSALVDAAQLESAILNLALNARDAMPAGGRLAIEATNLGGDRRHLLPRELQASDYVRISIEDTGVGMSREVIARAFEPFFSTKPEGSGTGLGLAMVFAFAQQCRGLASIFSEPGHGSTVRLYLPRALPQTVTDVHPDLASSALVRPRQIMVVEDDASIRGIAAVLLRELGYQVSEAADAEQALMQLQSQTQKLDLLVTDLSLPGAIDGHALAARVRRASPETRVLFISGHPDVPDCAEGETMRWLGKPFRRHQLAAAVRDMVARRSADCAA